MSRSAGLGSGSPLASVTIVASSSCSPIADQIVLIRAHARLGHTGVAERVFQFGDELVAVPPLPPDQPGQRSAYGGLLAGLELVDGLLSQDPLDFVLSRGKPELQWTLHSDGGVAELLTLEDLRERRGARRCLVRCGSCRIGGRSARCPWAAAPCAWTPDDLRILPNMSTALMSWTLPLRLAGLLLSRIQT